jgi:hypothetical protein
VAVLVLICTAALEVQAGVAPAWLGVVVGGLAAGAAGALAPLVAIRDILFDRPVALTAFGAITLAVCGLWLRLALRPPTWRLAG